MSKFIILILIFVSSSIYAKEVQRPNEAFRLSVIKSDSKIHLKATRIREVELNRFGVDNLFQWCQNVLFFDKTQIGINPQCYLEIISETGEIINYSVTVSQNQVNISNLDLLLSDGVYVVRLKEMESGAYTIPTILRFND